MGKKRERSLERDSRHFCRRGHFHFRAGSFSMSASSTDGVLTSRT
jgi:hypothetical protein